MPIHSGPSTLNTGLSQGIIFDGDDTLWETMPLYTEAKGRFYDLMAAAGFDRGAAGERFEAIDHANVMRFGFSQERFPRSMVETYEELCREAERGADEPVAAEARSIGEIVFERVAPAMPGAEDVLCALKDDFVLILATKGDRRVQERRIKQSGLRNHFNVVYVLEHKTEKEIGEIVEERKLDPERSWAVGNSLRSDVNPSLAAGLLSALLYPDTCFDLAAERRSVPILRTQELLNRWPLPESRSCPTDLLLRGQEVVQLGCEPLGTFSLAFPDDQYVPASAA